MSTAPTPGSYRTPAVAPPTSGANCQPNLDLVRMAPAGLVLRRRTTFEQGRGLEILGHALEYLVDSRMHLIDEPHTGADSEATQILMRLSRQIFHECVDVIPVSRRLQGWFGQRLRSSSN